MEEVDQTVVETEVEETEQEPKTEKATEKKPEADKPKETLEQRKSRLERQLKQTRKQMGEDVDEAETPSKKAPSDLDNGQKALLRSMGIKGADELQLAKDFMKRTGQDIDSLESDDIFQAKLTKLRDTKANELAADGKTGRGTTATDPVAKVLAQLGPNDPIPEGLSREVREAVVDARRAKGKTSKTFYNE